MEINKCDRVSCILIKRANENHCCLRCKQNGTHGPYCSRISYLTNKKQVPMVLSFPRSGSHLTRFFIELLSEAPTVGGPRNKLDIPIYLNIFPKEIPFNITKFEDYDKDLLYLKTHNVTYEKVEESKLIFLVRNPREVLLRHTKFKLNINKYNEYFDIIDYYNRSTAKKVCFFYEDMLQDKDEFIIKLYNFLEIKKPQKKEYVLKNLEELYTLSASGGYKGWGGVNSDFKTDYYYDKIPENIKQQFDDYLKTKLDTGNYDFLRIKYGL